MVHISFPIRKTKMRNVRKMTVKIIEEFNFFYFIIFLKERFELNHRDSHMFSVFVT